MCGWGGRGGHGGDMGLFQSVRLVNKKQRSVRSERHALLSISCVHFPRSLLQGPSQIPVEKHKVNNFNGWLCRADVQTKRLISVSQVVSPSQRLKSSRDEDTPEIFMGKDHTQSQGDAGAAALCSGYTCEESVHL